jgi:hypothetical protein
MQPSADISQDPGPLAEQQIAVTDSSQYNLPKVSRHAVALSAFEPVTSPNQNNFATIALKAIAEMQVSADLNKTCNRFNITQSIFQSIDAFVTNFQLILIVDSFQLKQELVDFSSSNAFSIANLGLVSEGAHRRFVSSTIYSKSFELIDVSVPNKNKMCDVSQLAANEHKCLNKSNTSFFQLKQELVDFSSSNAFSIATKLDSSLNNFQCQSSISVNTKASSVKLNETPLSQ